MFPSPEQSTLNYKMFLQCYTAFTPTKKLLSLALQTIIHFDSTSLSVITGWPRNRENREFGSYFFQTGKTQGILF